MDSLIGLIVIGFIIYVTIKFFSKKNNKNVIQINKNLKMTL